MRVQEHKSKFEIDFFGMFELGVTPAKWALRYPQVLACSQNSQIPRKQYRSHFVPLISDLGTPNPVLPISVFLRDSIFYICRTCKFNTLRFNHGASLARSGRAPRISYAGRARPKTYPLCGGYVFWPRPYDNWG